MHDNIISCKETQGRSTIRTGINLIMSLYEAWERSQDALGILCDLSKTFDCVQHSTLVMNLHHNSYLSNRVQKVDKNGKKSSASLFSAWVPQGFILGPFLFSIYMNDLPHLVGKNLLADDIPLILQMNRRKTYMTM